MAEFRPNQEGIIEGGRWAPGGHWAQTMVIGVESEKSQNVPHVEEWALFALGTWRQLFCTLAIWFGARFLPKTSAAKRVRGSNGST